MDRNLVFAIVLSIVIIVVFQYFFQAFSPPPQKVPSTTEGPKETAPPRDARPEEFKPPETDPRPAQPVAEDPRAVKSAESAETEVKDVRITVDGLTYRAVISSIGGRIVSFELKDYREKLNGNTLVNLFPPDAPDTSGPSIIFTEREERFNDSAVRYHYDSSETSVKLREKGAKRTIMFRAPVKGGITIEKSYTFTADSYSIDFSFALTNTSNEPRNYLITFPWKKYFDRNTGTSFAWDSAEILLNGELKDYYFDKIRGDEEPSGSVQWAGLGSVYFLKALVFGKTPASKVTLFKPSQDGVAEIKVRYGGMDVPPGTRVAADLSVYLGPKERQALSAAGNDLSRALFYSNYAVLDIMAEYLMKFLRFCNSGFTLAGLKIPGTNNYGLDIILLTIVIKILFIPLTHKSMKSMKKMQDLQPEIAKLKDKYKDDKQAMNKAMMDLFKQYKVSPLSGCWPMFVQLPVFIALYQALSYAIELRHAPFVCMPSIYLCINDLSAPDPYYVTPILMGGTMVLQQWMTPSAGDPMQKKMMLLMPVVFTYLFLSFPSGLVLYWLVSNVLGIGQQLLTNRMAR
ncbi:MAG: membrane protein insertase YidC [Desulfomonilaceae bacterium]|nr:membrane protein insertase YidC [Desulfomonilaceae bacterium]